MAFFLIYELGRLTHKEITILTSRNYILSTRSIAWYLFT